MLLCFGAALACSATVLLVFQSDLTFLADDWQFLIGRRGASAEVFLDPHNNHIAALPVAIYKVLLETAGMRSVMPFSIVATLVFLLSTVALFAYLRRRIGDWAALLAAVLILFLGAAWIDLLWSFQIGFSGSIAAGIGALLALDRDDRRGDSIACVLLVVSTCFSELGVPFALGALVNVAAGPQPRRGRLFVPLIPLVLYGLWFLGWGHEGPNTLSLDNVLGSPAYVFDAVSQAFASLLGLATPLSGDGSEPVGLIWGRILFVAALVLALWRLRRKREISRGLLTVATVGGSFWFLAAFNAYLDWREPTNGRYQYPSAVFVLLIAGELLRGVRLDRRVLAGATVVTAAAAVSGLFFLHDGYVLQKQASGAVRARLAGLEIARPGVNPDVEFNVDLFNRFPAGSYFAAFDDYGFPGYTESELAESGGDDRVAADAALASALEIGMTPRGAPGRGACRAISRPSAGAKLPLGAGGYALMTRAAGAEVRLLRFADEPWIEAGALEPGRWSSLILPEDLSSRPWSLSATGSAPLTICDT